MPYFKNDNINLLFIHIPKTGGSSLEEYFSYKYNIPLNNKSLYLFLSTENEENNNIIIDSSLQHLSYETIMKYKEYFQIDASNIEIISIVRNPYNRIISDLFFFKKINIDSSKEDVYNEVVTYFTEYNDNHVTPQYLFITDENKQLIKDIKLLKTESLTDDMINLGYTDFNIISNANPNKLEYDDYLNDESINLINNFYEEDFKILGYDKRIVDC